MKSFVGEKYLIHKKTKYMDIISREAIDILTFFSRQAIDMLAFSRQARDIVCFEDSF